jgi:hypothetical protein
MIVKAGIRLVIIEEKMNGVNKLLSWHRSSRERGGRRGRREHEHLAVKKFRIIDADRWDLNSGVVENDEDYLDGRME